MRLFTLFTFLAISSLALPFVAHAGIPFLDPIVPQGYNVVIDGRETQCPAGWGMFVLVINNIIAFLITFAILFVAPIMIAWSGFLFVTNPFNSGGIEQAKKILTNTIVGIVIALAGYAIVTAIMAVLYNPNAPNGGSTLGAWMNLISNTGDACLRVAGAPHTPGVITVQPPVVVVPGVLNGFRTGCSSSNDANASTLANAGVAGSSSGNCCNRNQSNCTSLDGMMNSTVSQIINVKNRCGSITVTGGTEVGHSDGGANSHGGGGKFDVSRNLISCITGTTGSTIIASPTFGSSQVRDRCGNLYTWEGNHTDVLVVGSCSL